MKRKILILFTIIFVVSFTSCSLITDIFQKGSDPAPNNPINPSGDLGSLDDYTLKCQQVLFTKGGDGDYVLVFFTFEDGTGSWGNLCNGKLNGEDVKVINYWEDPIQELTFTKKSGLWVGTDSQTGEVNYYINKSGEDRDWDYSDIDYLSIDKIDYCIVEVNSKQYFTNLSPYSSLPEHEEIDTYLKDGVYSTSNLPTEQIITWDYGDETPLTVNGKITFGNTVYYLSEDE